MEWAGGCLYMWVYGGECVWWGRGGRGRGGEERDHKEDKATIDVHYTKRHQERKSEHDHTRHCMSYDQE